MDECACVCVVALLEQLPHECRVPLPGGPVQRREVERGVEALRGHGGVLEERGEEGGEGAGGEEESLLVIGVEVGGDEEDDFGGEGEEGELGL